MNHWMKFKFRVKNDGLKNSATYYVNALMGIICRGIVNGVAMVEQCLPLREMMVFECESDLDDNPRAFYEYLLKEQWNLNHSILWIVNDITLCREKYKQKNVVFLNRNDKSCINQIRLNYFLLVSKYFIFSHPYWFKKKRKEQIVFNIDHGLPMKKPRSEKEYEIAKCFDYIICPSEYMKPIFLKRYKCAEEQLVYFGYPRCDYLYNAEKEAILTKLIQYKVGEKVIVCMPTFRQTTNIIDAPDLDNYCLSVVKNENDVQILNEELKKYKIHLLVKPHPLQRTDVICASEFSNIHYVFNRDLLNSGVLLYQLLGCSDALITDLSSVGYDYSLCGKPMGFFVNNIESYIRGSIWDDPEQFINGYRITSFENLKFFISCVYNNVDDFLEKRNAFARKVWGENTKEASKQIADWLFDNRIER